MGIEYMPGWRAARIEEMLSEKERYSLRDMEEMQMDVTSKFAAAIVPFFTHLNSDDSFMKVAIGYLRKWTFQIDADSTPALILHYALLFLLREVYGNKLGPLSDPFLEV